MANRYWLFIDGHIDHWKFPYPHWTDYIIDVHWALCDYFAASGINLEAIANL
jgi:hypothetical protein